MARPSRGSTLHDRVTVGKRRRSSATRSSAPGRTSDHGTRVVRRCRRRRRDDRRRQRAAGRHPAVAGDRGPRSGDNVYEMKVSRHRRRRFHRVARLVDALLAHGHEVYVVDDLQQRASSPNLDDARRRGGQLEFHRYDIGSETVGDLFAAGQARGRLPLRRTAIRPGVVSRSGATTHRSTSSVCCGSSTRAVAVGAKKFVFSSSGGTIYGRKKSSRCPRRPSDVRPRPTGSRKRAVGGLPPLLPRRVRARLHVTRARERGVDPRLPQRRDVHADHGRGRDRRGRRSHWHGPCCQCRPRPRRQSHTVGYRRRPASNLMELPLPTDAGSVRIAAGLGRIASGAVRARRQSQPVPARPHVAGVGGAHGAEDRPAAPLVYVLAAHVFGLSPLSLRCWSPSRPCPLASTPTCSPPATRWRSRKPRARSCCRPWLRRSRWAFLLSTWDRGNETLGWASVTEVLDLSAITFSSTGGGMSMKRPVVSASHLNWPRWPGVAAPCQGQPQPPSSARWLR